MAENTDKLIGAAEAGEVDPGVKWGASDDAEFAKMREADEAWAENRAAKSVREREEPTEAPQPSEPAPDDPAQLRQRAETAETNYRTLEQRANMLLAHMQNAAQQPAPPQYQIPDAGTDPIGHIIGKQQLIERHLVQQEQSRQQQVQLGQQIQIIGGLTQRAQALEKEFEASTPDYADAVKRLVEVRHRELEMAGIRTPAERSAHIQREGLELAAAALQQNRNPSEVIYELAQLRGHVPQSRYDNLRRIQTGQQHARSLGNARGRGPQPMTINRLLDMSDNEFSAAIDTPEGRALLGA